MIFFSLSFRRHKWWLISTTWKGFFSVLVQKITNIFCSNMSFKTIVFSLSKTKKESEKSTFESSLEALDPRSRSKWHNNNQPHSRMQSMKLQVKYKTRREINWKYQVRYCDLCWKWRENSEQTIVKSHSNRWG